LTVLFLVERAARTFSLIVFVCDGYLRLKNRPDQEKTNRFMRMAFRLPMELQMMLCNILFDYGKDVILTKDSEPAFRGLARDFGVPSL